MNTNWAEKCVALVPCFNEADSISGVLTEILRFVSKVIVVDDGSTDDTAAQARKAGAFVVPHTRRFGKGAALTTGVLAAVELGFEWALTLDGDGQHSPSDIPKFFSFAEQHGADLVVGNRMPCACAMPPVRRLTNLTMSWMISHRMGQSLPDTQCGFRLFRLEAWRHVEIRARHFEVESEMLVGFLKAGFRVGFVPVKVIYGLGGSKIRPLADSWRWLKWWFRGSRTSGKRGKISSCD